MHIKLKTRKHSSEIRGLCSTKCSRETLQKIFRFSFRATLQFCRHRPGYSKGKNIKLHKMKNKQKTMWVFLLLQ